MATALHLPRECDVGAEGAQVGILGQGFSSASVVSSEAQKPPPQSSPAAPTFSLRPDRRANGDVTVTTDRPCSPPRDLQDHADLQKLHAPERPSRTVVTFNGTGLTQTRSDDRQKNRRRSRGLRFRNHPTVPTGTATGKIVVTTKGGSLPVPPNHRQLGKNRDIHDK